MSDDQEGINSNNNGTCVVCYKIVEIYSIGMCEHPVCYECSTRMRVLCRQNECPICRQDLPKVVFTKTIQPFRLIRKGNLLDTRYNIFFDSSDIQEKFLELLAHVCPICEDEQVFSVFNSLKDHMKRKHDRHYCELCVENLKIFSFERRCYTRMDLARHRRKGDADDKSHKGHPLCEFCEQRYMDNDELFRHLRRDHLYCHFCDTDGLHQYYSSYDYLRDHFRQEHYLCEEGPCAQEELTSVFRTDIDLKVHKSSIHGKYMGKAAAKQGRTLELEFTLAPRGDSRNGRRGQSSGAGPSSSRNRDHYMDSRDLSEAESVFFMEPEVQLMKQPDVQSTAEFPSLGNPTPTFALGQSGSKGRGNLTIGRTIKGQTLAITDENFPALGPESTNPAGISKTVNFSVYSSNQSGPSGTQHPPNVTPNVSIHVNHKTDGSITTRVSGPNLRIRPNAQVAKKSDFPALGGGSGSGSGGGGGGGGGGGSSASSSSVSNTGQWTKVTCVKPSVLAKAKKLASSPNVNTPPKPPATASSSLSSFTNDFPSLPKSTKTKPQSATAATDNNSYSSSCKPSSSTEVSADRNTTNDTSTSNAKKKKKKKAKADSSNNSSINAAGTSKSNSSCVKSENHVKQEVSNQAVPKNIESPVGTLKKESEKLKKDKKTTQNNSNNQTSRQVDTSKGDSSSNSIRKRSELKIDNLNNTNNTSTKMEDFPALTKSSRASNLSNPPPGFGTATPPPPGFAVKLNSTERPRSENGLTFTNSSGESFSILPDERNESYSYSPPPDFQNRNKDLVAKISEVLERQDSIEEFRYFSGLFRQGTCSADDYYKRCQNAMGLSEFATVFPEMLVLLPDIRKQRELFDLHKKEVGKVTGLELCSNCGQVVKSNGDLRSHLSTHTLESHFPALGQATAIQSFSNWPRKGT